MGRSWLAAGALVVGATGAFALDARPAAVVLATAALALVLLVRERDVPETLPAVAAAGLTAALADVTRGLSLQGRGVYVPPRDGAAPVTLFLPARDLGDAGDVPVLDEVTVVHRGGSGAAGLALSPPGAGLEAAWRAMHGDLPTGQGPEEAAAHVRAAFSALDLATDVTLAQAEGRVRVAYRPGPFGEVCRASRTHLAPWAVQGGCPPCSLAAMLVARAVGAPIVVRDTREEADGRVILDLEVLARSEASGSAPAS